jgi:hypothetical protein
VEPVFRRNFEFVYQNSLRHPDQANPGLYYGGYGLAAAIVESIESTLIDDFSGEIRHHAETTLKVPCHGLNVASGLAGQGLAVLKYLDIFPSAEMELLLQHIIESIVVQQAPDGGWLTDKNKKETSFSAGAAGIIIFLLQCLPHYKNAIVLAATEKALAWLRLQVNITNGGRGGYNDNKDDQINPCLGNDHVGLALCFIRAFEQFHNPLYQEIAQDILLNLPARPVLGHFGLLYGLAGWGEVYLEAYRVFGKALWIQRAAWIAQVVSRVCCYHDDGSCHWKNKGILQPTADFATGQTGVLHFLMRYESKGTLSFPML